MTGAARVVGVLALSVLIAGCADSLGPNDEVVVSTERDRYQVDEVILVTLENKGNAEFVFPRCGDQVRTVIEKRVGSDWVEHARFGEVCLGIYSAVPLELDPGAQYQYEISLIEEGDYRLRVHEMGRESGKGFPSSVLTVVG